MSGNADRSEVRLAELVAALSLGIDLGFGQPMEHVLRQCLIALRLAERLGLDEEARAVVYYTALLINVGCHTDAHEQAKWFGDDIALKSGKYDHELGSVRAAAAGLRRLGAGRPPLHRFRVGLEFALSGHREVDDMISQHARRARTLAEQLALPEEVLDAIGGAYEQWDGRGWPGALKGDDVPLASRISQLAEFVEVAHRVGGIEAATSLARRRGGKQFDPALAALLCSEANEILGGLEFVGNWETVIGAEPALGVVLSGERFDDALAAIANFVDLKSPYLLGHSRAVADLAAEAAVQLGLPEREVRTLRRAGLGSTGSFRKRSSSRAQWLEDEANAPCARASPFVASVHAVEQPPRRPKMNATALAELAKLKRGARATWAAGDFPAIAQRQLWEVGPRIVDAVQIKPGEDVLDVACGTGNAAIRAAEAGGRVVGVDLTPELFDAGRRLATDAGVEIEWVHGDAEDLPFDDESFDVVLSTFGCMFAPRHEVTAHELARVLRPGGRLGITSWTPDGAMGTFFKTVGAYLPPPSALAEPPALWGSESHVEELFEGTDVELDFARDVVTPEPFESSEAALEFFETKFGPMMMARQLTEASGDWPRLRTELASLYELDEPIEYLVTVGHKAAR